MPLNCNIDIASTPETGTEPWDIENLTSEQIALLEAGVSCGALSASMLNTLFRHLQACSSQVRVYSEVTMDTRRPLLDFVEAPFFFDSVVTDSNNLASLANNQFTLDRDGLWMVQIVCGYNNAPGLEFRIFARVNTGLASERPYTLRSQELTTGGELESNFSLSTLLIGKSGDTVDFNIWADLVAGGNHEYGWSDNYSPTRMSVLFMGAV